VKPRTVNKTQLDKPVGLLPFNRRRIIDLAIRDADYLERWIADPFTPPANRDIFTLRLMLAVLRRNRALALKARLPPEWTGPKQPSML
jgi:hypothetical protein